jgi:hypothetical protein
MSDPTLKEAFDAQDYKSWKRDSGLPCPPKPHIEQLTRSDVDQSWPFPFSKARDQPTIKYGSGYELTPGAIIDPSPKRQEALPIETAPKDGSQVLLFYRKTGEELHERARWALGLWFKHGWGPGAVPFWSVQGTHFTRAQMMECPPTHWSPLPGDPAL